MRKILTTLLLVASSTLVACGSTSGNYGDDLRRLAGVTPTVAPPTLTPAILPTETPDLQTQTPTPAPVEVTSTPDLPEESPVTLAKIDQVVEATVTPACNALTPAPTVALDATDIATGVIVRGHWPCGIVGYPAQGVTP